MNIKELTEVIEGLKKEIAEIKKANEGKTEAELKELVEKQVSELNAKLEEYDKKLVEFEKQANEPSKPIFGDGVDGKVDTKKLYEISDAIYLYSILKGVNPVNTPLYQKYKNQLKALSTNSNGDWIPTGFSRQLIEEVELDLRVPKLHEFIDLPTDPYKYPILSADEEAYFIPESISDTADKIPTTSLGDGLLEFSTKKFGARVLVSTELTEDAVFDVLAKVKERLRIAVTKGLENATINGDNAGTMDAGLGTYDVRKAWDGYRKIGLSVAGLDCGGDSLNAEDLINLRALLGKYAVDINNLAFIVGLDVYLKNLINLKDSAGNRLVLSIDKYGANATIMKGEVGKLFGIPIIVSSYIPEKVNSSGVIDATASNNTTKTLVLVNKNMFKYGRRRKITVKTAEDIERDQQIVVVTARYDFKSIYQSEPTVGVAYNFVI